MSLTTCNDHLLDSTVSKYSGSRPHQRRQCVASSAPYPSLISLLPRMVNASTKCPANKADPHYDSTPPWDLIYPRNQDGPIINPYGKYIVKLFWMVAGCILHHNHSGAVAPRDYRRFHANRRRKSYFAACHDYSRRGVAGPHRKGHMQACICWLCLHGSFRGKRISGRRRLLANPPFDRLDPSDDGVHA